jgi:hypothetical protein
MNYRITKGDLEITKNVLMQLSLDTYKKLERENKTIKYDTDCPSYDAYQTLVDVLCFVDNYTKALTK